MSSAANMCQSPVSIAAKKWEESCKRFEERCLYKFAQNKTLHSLIVYPRVQAHHFVGKLQMGRFHHFIMLEVGKKQTN